MQWEGRLRILPRNVQVVHLPEQMNRYWLRTLWIVSVNARISSFDAVLVLERRPTSTANPIANAQLRDRHRRPSPSKKPRPEPWETSRKCSHGPFKENVLDFEIGNRSLGQHRADLKNRSLRCGKPSKIAGAARRSVRSSLRVLDRFACCGSVPIMGAMQLPFSEGTTDQAG